jgi:hypothetical protein
MAWNWAACPLEAAQAAMPPSSAAIRCSKTAIVGFSILIHTTGQWW